MADYFVCIDRFIEAYKQEGPDGIDHEYDKVRTVFHNMDNESTEDLAAALFRFLYRWGMTRNDAALGKLKGQGLEPVVEVIRKYKHLENADIYGKNFNDTAFAKDLVNFAVEITKCLADAGLSCTDTMVTKILLGSLGCYVALDQHAVNFIRDDSKLNNISLGLSKNDAVRGMGTRRYNNLVSKVIKFLNRLREDDYKNAIQKAQEAYKGVTGVEYSPMKFADMIVWQGDKIKIAY